MKEKQTAQIAIIVGFIVTVCLVLGLLIKTSGSSETEKYALNKITIYSAEKKNDGYNYYIRGHFSRAIKRGELLYLCPENIEVTLTINDKVVYEFVNKENVLSTPGKDVAMLNLGDIDVTDTVEMTIFAPGYSEYDGNVFEDFLESMIVGSGQAIYQYLISEKWIGIVCSLILMFLGFAYLAYALIYYKGHYSDVKYNLAFGFLSFSFGAYMFVQSLGNMLPLLITNSLWCSILEISLLYISISSFTLYLYICATRRIARKVQYVLTMFVLINLIIILLGEMFLKAEMYTSKELMERILFGFLATSILAGIVELFDRDSFQTRRFFLGLIPTVIGVAVTIFAKYYFKADVHQIVYICILADIGILALGIASDSRVAQRNLAYLTKQVMVKKDELDRAMELVSVSRKKAAKLESDKEFAEAKNQVDIMTGLYNKTAMQKMVSNYLQNNNTEGVAVIFIDLDHFKTLNDTLGHMIGDDAIRDAAKKLTVSFRQYDLVSRFGGDEFCVFLRNIKEEFLVNKLEALVETLKGTYTNGTYQVSITGSVGCAYCISERADYDKLIKLADRAVYEAKEGGRNRFVILKYQ